MRSSKVIRAIGLATAMLFAAATAIAQDNPGGNAGQAPSYSVSSYGNTLIIKIDGKPVPADKTVRVRLIRRDRFAGDGDVTLSTNAFGEVTLLAPGRLAQDASSKPVEPAPYQIELDGDVSNAYIGIQWDGQSMQLEKLRIRKGKAAATQSPAAETTATSATRPFTTYGGTLVVKKPDGAPATGQWIDIRGADGTRIKTGLTSARYGDLAFDSFAKPLAPGRYLVEWGEVRTALIWNGSDATLAPLTAAELETATTAKPSAKSPRSEGTARGGVIIAKPKVIRQADAPAATPEAAKPDAPGATPSVEFKEATLRLEVTPSVTPDDRINLKLSTTPSAALSTPSGTLSAGQLETRIQGLSDTPSMGFLLFRPTEQEADSELLIFMTPQIAEPKDESAQDAKKDTAAAPAKPTLGMWQLDASIGVGKLWFANLQKNVKRGARQAINSGTATNVRTSTEKDVPMMEVGIGLIRDVGDGSIRAGLFYADARTMKGHFTGDFIPGPNSFLISGESDINLYGVDLRWQQPLTQDGRLQGEVGVGYVVLDQEDVSKSYVINPIGASALVARSKESDSDGEPYWRLGMLYEFFNKTTPTSTTTATIGASYQRTVGGIGPNGEELSSALVSLGVKVSW